VCPTHSLSVSNTPILRTVAFSGRAAGEDETAGNAMDRVLSQARAPLRRAPTRRSARPAPALMRGAGRAGRAVSDRDGRREDGPRATRDAARGVRAPRPHRPGPAPPRAPRAPHRAAAATARRPPRPPRRPRCGVAPRPPPRGSRAPPPPQPYCFPYPCPYCTPSLGGSVAPPAPRAPRHRISSTGYQDDLAPPCARAGVRGGGAADISGGRRGGRRWSRWRTRPTASPWPTSTYSCAPPPSPPCVSLSRARGAARRCVCRRRTCVRRALRWSGAYQTRRSGARAPGRVPRRAARAREPGWSAPREREYATLTLQTTLQVARAPAAR